MLRNPLRTSSHFELVVIIPDRNIYLEMVPSSASDELPLDKGKACHCRRLSFFQQCGVPGIADPQSNLEFQPLFSLDRPFSNCYML
jgi:hypothetical protein